MTEYVLESIEDQLKQLEFMQDVVTYHPAFTEAYFICEPHRNMVTTFVEGAAK